MKSVVKISLLLLFFVSITGYTASSQVITSRSTSASFKKSSYADITLLEIKTSLKNKSSKVVSKVFISAYFRDKRYSDSDITAPSQEEKSESEITIYPNQEIVATFLVFPPKDINMIYKSARIERIIYTDGSFVDL